jgi:hypothetical protein
VALSLSLPLEEVVEEEEEVEVVEEVEEGETASAVINISSNRGRVALRILWYPLNEG